MIIYKWVKRVKIMRINIQLNFHPKKRAISDLSGILKNLIFNQI